jgi:HSP20 family protein
MFENRSLLPSLRSDRFLSPFSTFRDDILDLIDDFSSGLTPALGTSLVSSEFVPRIEVKDKGNSYIVSAEVPGMSDEDMNVTIKDNNLILEGEKKEEHTEDKGGLYRSEFSYGSFYRVIPLSDDIDPEKVSAAYTNGVLKVTVDKLPEAQRHTKKIPISKEGGKSGKTIEAKSGKEPDTKH